MLTRYYFFTTLLLILTSINSYALDKKRIKQHQIDSKAASQTLKFEVILPKYFKPEDKQPYPVLYTTTGDNRKDILVEQLDWLSHVSMGPMPPVIIVTIPQIKVQADMHPKYISASGITNKTKLAALKQEIIPFVEQHYPTAPLRILEGFSSNGNFTLFSYLYSNNLFQTYIASSPALELDQTKLINSFNQVTLSKLANSQQFYLSLGPFSGNKSLYQSIKQALTKQKAQAYFKNFSQQNFLSVPISTLTWALEETFADLSPTASLFAQSSIGATENL